MPSATVSSKKIGRKAEVTCDPREQPGADAVEFGEQFVIGGAKPFNLGGPDIVWLLRGEAMADGQVSADVPEFLEVDRLCTLGDFGPERGIAARAAAAGDMIGSLCFLREREKGFCLVPRLVDQRGVDAMVGDHGKAEAFERGAKVFRELIGGKRHRNGRNSGSHHIIHIGRRLGPPRLYSCM